jgi:hypothetical protein
VRYHFSQRFRVPVKKAFAWTIDFRPDDIARMGEKGNRKIEPISEGTFLLTDTTYANGRPVAKPKLINVYPDLLMYLNTHVGGPFRNSQFVYQFTPVGKGMSQLDFAGHLVLYTRKPLGKRALAKIAESERRVDSEAWKHLARAMEQDLASEK